MPTCLLALGSNLGEREQTLLAAIGDLAALTGTQLLRHSRSYPSRPVGGPAAQPDFLNAAAVVETLFEPAAFFAHLLQIEARHGRQRTGRWAPRTLDLDLLLFDDRVIDTPSLCVPHPRMSFRRFVLTPAAEVATPMVHPTIGWTIGQLAAHLGAAGDQAAILSPQEAARLEWGATLASQYGAQISEPPRAAGSPDAQAAREMERLWPRRLTTWLTFPSPRPPSDRVGRQQQIAFPFSVANHPKLTILLDAEPIGLPADTAEWPAVLAQRGRGPTLRVAAADRGAVDCEIQAAVESVWPDLGHPDPKRIE